MPLWVKNWQTTIAGFVPLMLYAVQWAGYWPAWAPPLPPFNWTVVLASAGIGTFAKDSNVTGGTKQQ